MNRPSFPHLRDRANLPDVDAGVYRLGNLLAPALALYLAWPALWRPSAEPLLWGYSGRHLALAAGAGLCLAAWLGAIAVLGRSRQRAIFFVSLAVFVGLEGLFRLDAVASRFTPIHHFREIAPYVTFTGARDPAPSGPAGPGEYRIVMLGGSTVNTGDPALPKALEEVFHASGRGDVRVYNYGVVSYISRQERLLLELEVLACRPDLVIVYDGGNDVYQPYFGDPRPQYPYNWATFEAGYAAATNQAGFRRRVSLALRSSALLRSLFDAAVFREDVLRLTELRSGAGYGRPEWRKALADGWRDDWESMIRLGRERGFRTALFLQPFLTEKTPLAPEEQAIDARYDEVFRQHMRACYANLRQGLETFPPRDGVLVRDLSRALDDFEGQAFTDVIHVSAQANRHLARRIFEAVTPLAAVPSPVTAP